VIYVEYARQRYDAAILEIERLKQSEFPYSHIREALIQLEGVFRKQRDQLDKLTGRSTPAIAKNACSQSLAYLFIYTPYLGFILRATNVRNAFELYAPVMRLARKLLGDKTKLLLSSEWGYSPFVYLPTNDLPDCVLIGIPAFESANPLLVSLAGHELGHNVWSSEDLGGKVDINLRNEVLSAIRGPNWSDFQNCFPHATPHNLTTDMFVQQAWLPAHAFAKRQLEEVFCDMMGLRLFAEAYLHAFAYLLSPCLPGERTPFYPSIATRVKYMLNAAPRLGVSPPAGFSDLFEVGPAPPSTVTGLLISIADSAVLPLVDTVVCEARNFADSKGVPMRSADEIKRVLCDWRMVMPTDGTVALADLVNAGWILFHDGDLWKDVPQIRPQDRTRILHDLILKSCEVAEFSERTTAG
jgi:hypothetical protein